MDNRYWSYGCPALMQDGRFLTNYVRFNVFDQNIRYINNIETAFEYRKFLQTNGDIILNREREFLNKNNRCQVNGACLPLNGKEQGNILPCGNCTDNNNINSSCETV
jgi:hypothetical protein